MSKQRISIYDKFVPGIVPPKNRETPAMWFIFCRGLLLIHDGESLKHIPLVGDLTELGLTPVRQQYLGHFDGCHCYSAELSKGTPAPQGMEFASLRELSGYNEQLFSLAGLAKQIVDWDSTHQFCGRCGAPTSYETTARAKKCPRCGLTNFPRLSPAIIVLIERGNEVLLARASRFTKGWYSVLAGFVEPGETLEEAVEREVREEVGINIKNIAYFGSQPWPFPNSLMLGFTAEYERGDICIDQAEIEDARWFTLDNLPNLPGKISIARQLIDHFIAKHPG